MGMAASERTATACGTRVGWLLGVLIAASCGADGAAVDAGGPPADTGVTACEGVEVSEAIRVTDALGSSLFPALAWDGAALGLTWYDERDGNAVMFAALDADGQKLTNDVRLSAPLAIAESPAITAADGGFGVVWEQFVVGADEIHFAAVSAEGETAGPIRQLTQTGDQSTRPVVAGFGPGFAVAWVETPDNGTNEEIYTARLTADGDRPGDIVRVTDDPASSYAPSIVGGDEGYAVAWHDWRNGNGDLYLAQMDAVGQPIGAARQLTSDAADSFVPSLSRASDGGYGVAWHDNRGSVWDVYVALVDASGVVPGAETRVSEGLADGNFPALVFSGSELGIAWHEEIDGNRQRVLFARYSPSGERRGENVMVAEGPAMSSQPALAWTGSGYAVAWQDNRDGNYEIYLAILACQ